MYWWSIQQLFLLLLFSPLLTRHVFHGHVGSFLSFVCFAFGTTVFAEYMVKKKENKHGYLSLRYYVMCVFYSPLLLLYEKAESLRRLCFLFMKKE